ncbi:MAG: hypothetical protein M3Q05_15650 [Bacteroidota bacterium]|nr:hypothetical protein [Bacteroidota bacterium]
MKRIVFGVVLAAFLMVTSIVFFINVQDSIILYVREQNGKLVSGSFLNDLNSSRDLSVSKRSQKEKAEENSGYKADDPLHKILREIALCR